MGIILWELVTLMTPARGNLRSVRVPGECPANVAHLIEDCLNANNPDDRPTASQIYDRLVSRYASFLCLCLAAPRAVTLSTHYCPRGRS